MSQDSDSDDLPILQHIGSAPRYLPLAVRVYLRSCSGFDPLYGWLFGVSGLTVVLIGVALVGLDDYIPRTWIDAGKAKITDVELSNFSIFKKRIYVYHFEAAGRIERHYRRSFLPLTSR
jgi:hypothetical protein